NWDVEAFGRERIGAENRRAADVGDDTDASTGRRWLGGEQRGYVKQLLERVRANHARLVKKRFDGHVGGRQERPSVRGGGPRAGRRATALDGNDRLRPADPPRDAAELARVPKRLKV